MATHDKTLVDKTIAAVLIVILSPLLFVIALAVKLQGAGPVLFQQAPGHLDSLTLPAVFVDHRQHPEGSAILRSIHDKSYDQT